MFQNEIMWDSKQQIDKEREIGHWTLRIMSRYETLTSQALTKEMFINPIKVIDEDWNLELEREKLDYTAAQKKVWFAGFVPNVFTKENHLYYSTGIECISWSSTDTNLRLPNGKLTELGSVVTIADLIYNITKYNETATSKITLSWTEAFVEALNKV